MDPDESQVKDFKDKISSKQQQSQWKNVNFEFHQTTIEEYLTEAKKSEVVGMDIIHAQHCAYHFSDPENVIVDLYRILNKGGMLFTIMSVGM